MVMFRGDTEVLARRKTLAVLQDEMRQVMEMAREIPNIYSAIMDNDTQKQQAIFKKVLQGESDVENFRRNITRELAELGAMVMSREDVLRTAFTIEKIVHYTDGIVFRLIQINRRTLKRSKLDEDIKELIDLVVETTQKLNDAVRSLILNPIQTTELSSYVEKLEKQIDEKYRILTTKGLKEIKSFKTLLIIMDLIERIENMADTCLEASDLVTIMALSL
jgi:uncharacterized protein Yka (UPF0111/DUF47 family)